MKTVNISIESPTLYANSNFARLMSNRDDTIISYGSRNSGKSYNFAQKIVYNVMHESYCRAVLIRKVYRDIRATQYDTIMSVIKQWKLEHLFTATLNPLMITCVNGNIIMSCGLDREGKTKSINDPTLMWFEEADEITLDDYLASELALRTNVPDALVQTLVSFNPSGDPQESWIHDFFFPPHTTYEKANGDFDFIKSIRPRTTIIHSNYNDNRFCSSRNKEKYANIKVTHPDYYKTHLLGLWGGTDKDLVFPEIFYRHEFPKKEDCRNYGYGLDFGFTNSPTALVECALYQGEIYVRELCYETGLVPVTTSIDKGSIAKVLHRENVRGTVIHADPSHGMAISELQDEGFHIRKVSKPKKSVEESLSAIKAYRINVVDSPNLKKEFKNYRYEMRKDGTVDDTKNPIKAFDHLIDAMRYWFMAELWKKYGIGIMVID